MGYAYVFEEKILFMMRTHLVDLKYLPARILKTVILYNLWCKGTVISFFLFTAATVGINRTYQKLSNRLQAWQERPSHCALDA